MRWFSSGVIGFLALVVVCFGCGTQSIPRVAANGSTITIPVPDGFGAGFGRVLNEQLPFGPVDPATISVPLDPNSPLEDLQRGELLVALRFTPYPTSGLSTYLPVRYVTRVQPDEGSRAATLAAGEDDDFDGTPPASGQVLALVDIPRELGAGTYYIFPERWVRDTTPGQQDHFVKDTPTINSPAVDWVAWSGTVPFYGTPSPSYGMAIRIVNSSFGGSLFNDALAGVDRFFGNYSTRDFTQDLDRLVPRAKLMIRLQNPDPPSGEPAIPAAWKLTIQYPAGKVEVLGAELGTLQRSQAVVAVGAGPETPASCSAVGTTTISGVDPAQRGQWVNVVYRLRDFANCGRAQPGDFTIVAGSVKTYDANGQALSSPYAYLDDVYSFQ